MRQRHGCAVCWTRQGTFVLFAGRCRARCRDCLNRVPKTGMATWRGLSILAQARINRANRDFFDERLVIVDGCHDCAVCWTRQGAFVPSFLDEAAHVAASFSRRCYAALFLLTTVGEGFVFDVHTTYTEPRARRRMPLF